MTYDINKEGECRECGETFYSARRWGRFCSLGCRQTFHNRRAVRGAALYDMFMLFTFEPSYGTKTSVKLMLERMATSFRREDDEQRVSRPSWDEAGIVLQRNAQFLNPTAPTSTAEG